MKEVYPLKDFKQIKELVSLVNSTDITDLEIEEENFRIRIRKEQHVSNAVAVPLVEKVPSQPQVFAPIEQTISDTQDGLIEITAPMVGTFYRAPAPDAPPYVQVGETITPGQVLFIIEAMKMMNEIECEVKGIVRQFLVENGEPVEYGQALMLIDPKA
ncbi:MAG TPA: acetyl-CoA carboxylase biotin carboxyl carrier protein [Firmicutes bacterium]|jgi:acetyl-CoA carboxylase biotin carboxyl carrier protein|nr:acetyl-CoA carboxylase biotin carboxyl carrier protein [Bacillota bacterium]